jgi:RNA polymerase sigma factor (sigma-70 family)
LSFKQSEKIENLARKARNGNRKALERLAKDIHHPIYNLALRMLGYPDDAEDAAQEIMIKIITRLASFRGESAFTTWIYRIASNHLLTTRKRRAEKMRFSFETFEEAIDQSHAGLMPPAVMDPEQNMLVTEIRLACLHGLLICMKRETRIAFILGEIFNIPGNEGARILDITPAAFRKRVSRGRGRIRRFLSKNCGLVNPANPCHCVRQLKHDTEAGWIQPDKLPFTGRPINGQQPDDMVAQLDNLDEIGRLNLLLSSYPDYSVPDSSDVILGAFFNTEDGLKHPSDASKP